MFGNSNTKMHFSTLLSTALLLVTASGSAIERRQPYQPFEGRGIVDIVREKPSYYDGPPDPNDIIGCLTTKGKFTADRSKCAVFEHVATAGLQPPLTTSAGACGFGNSAAEAGSLDYAYDCGTVDASTWGALSYGPAGDGALWLAMWALYSVFEVNKMPVGGEEVGVFFYATNPLPQKVMMIFRRV